MELFHHQLLVITIIAALAPLFAELRLQQRIPVVVFEIGLGILVGPHVLKLMSPEGAISMLADLGLTFLLFLVGLEINIGEISGRQLTLAVGSWFLSFLLAMLCALLFSAIGLFKAPPLWVAVALSTTSMGILVPTLRDSNRLDSRFGRHLFAVATMGEFAPLIAISVLLIPTHAPVLHVLFMVAFLIISLAAAYLTLRARSSKLLERLARTLQSSGQLPVRICIALLALLVVLAEKFGINVIVGAFAAGLVVGTTLKEKGGAILRQKLDAIGFGFLIPIFFIVAGMRFDVSALWSSPLVPIQLIVLLGLLVVIRGVPALLYRQELKREERMPFALYSATGLPLIVAITELGVSSGFMAPDRAALLVSAGMISVLAFPLLAQRRLAPSEPEQ
jgi:Kef-type K+ transport system membrane component KefB